MKDATALAIVAMPILGAMAIANLIIGGPDGAVFLGVVGIIAWLGGYGVGRGRR